MYKLKDIAWLLYVVDILTMWMIFEMSGQIYQKMKVVATTSKDLHVYVEPKEYKFNFGKAISVMTLRIMQTHHAINLIWLLM
jgi:hypothetical protein